MRCFEYRSFCLTAAAILISAIAAGLARAGEPSSSRASSFTIFDNMFYPKKPSLVADGFKDCNIVYAGYVWQGAEKSPTYGDMPDEATYKKTVQAHSTKPGPVVLDFETLRLSGKPELVEAHFKLFMTLVKWTHEAAPGHVVGFYGHGLFPEQPAKEYAQQARQLADAVDAFFPSMYTFTEDRDGWKKKAEGLLQQAHQIAPGKPVYFYIWPQFHGGTHEFLKGDQWAFELQTARDIGADGVVFWSSSKSPPWDVNAPWWQETLKFLKQQ
jgi:hypothetical protein